MLKRPEAGMPQVWTCKAVASLLELTLSRESQHVHRRRNAQACPERRGVKLYSGAPGRTCITSSWHAQADRMHALSGPRLGCLGRAPSDYTYVNKLNDCSIATYCKNHIGSPPTNSMPGGPANAYASFEHFVETCAGGCFVGGGFKILDFA